MKAREGDCDCNWHFLSACSYSTRRSTKYKSLVRSFLGREGREEMERIVTLTLPPRLPFLYYCNWVSGATVAIS